MNVSSKNNPRPRVDQGADEITVDVHTRHASPPALRPPPSVEEQGRVSQALPMVQQCADEVVARLRGRVRRETLLGPGTLGLYDAARTYREEEHPAFAIYARHRILGEMLDAVGADNVPTRERVERIVQRAYERFAAREAEEADRLDDAEEETVGGDHEAGDDAAAVAFFAGVLEAQGSTPEGILDELEGQEATFEMILDALDTLPPLERRVIHLVYRDGLTLDEVAAEIDVSPSTAQRRHAKALRKLRGFLVWRGVAGPRLLHF